MTKPLLLIFATRYDDVTRRTYGIANRLLAAVQQLRIAALPLFDGAATGSDLLTATADGPSVIAFYCHGDADGRMLAQDQEPCWTDPCIPDLSRIAVFVHACRAVRWLRDRASRHRARLLVGYEVDLMTPANGSTRFWDVYEEVHSFVPRHLAVGTDEASIRNEFYDLCTRRLHELNVPQAGLIELVAIRQSRDEIVFV